MRTIFILLAIFSSVCGYAQEEYKKMLTDGKVWYCKEARATRPNEEIYHVYTITVVGDTVVNGLLCKRLRYNNITENTVGYSAAYEEGKRVYAFYGDEMILYFDFGLNVGDKAVDYRDVYVESKEEILVKGRKYNRLTLNYKDGTEKSREYWVEGIGCEEKSSIATLISFPVGHMDYVLSCYDNGECIFTNDDFATTNTTAGVKAVETDRSRQKSSKMYDLTGKEVSRPQSGGVYIKDGKKVVY